MQKQAKYFLLSYFSSDFCWLEIVLII